MNDGIFDFRFAICDLKKRHEESSSQSQITEWNRGKAGPVVHCRSITNRNWIFDFGFAICDLKTAVGSPHRNRKSPTGIEEMPEVARCRSIATAATRRKSRRNARFATVPAIANRKSKIKNP
jgi:hypothetical protein